MRVIAKFQGFFNGERKRVGSSFDMPESAMKRVPLAKVTKSDVVVSKDAKEAILLPKWVVEDTPEDRKKFANAQKVAEERDLAAAKAAAGPKRRERGLAQAGESTDGTELV